MRRATPCSCLARRPARWCTGTDRCAPSGLSRPRRCSCRPERSGGSSPASSVPRSQPPRWIPTSCPLCAHYCCDYDYCGCLAWRSPNANARRHGHRGIQRFHSGYPDRSSRIEQAKKLATGRRCRCPQIDLERIPMTRDRHTTITYKRI